MIMVRAYSGPNSQAITFVASKFFVVSFPMYVSKK